MVLLPDQLGDDLGTQQRELACVPEEICFQLMGNSVAVETIPDKFTQRPPLANGTRILLLTLKWIPHTEHRIKEEIQGYTKI